MRPSGRPHHYQWAPLRAPPSPKSRSSIAVGTYPCSDSDRPINPEARQEPREGGDGDTADTGQCSRCTAGERLYVRTRAGWCDHGGGGTTVRRRVGQQHAARRRRSGTPRAARAARPRPRLRWTRWVAASRVILAGPRPPSLAVDSMAEGRRRTLAEGRRRTLAWSPRPWSPRQRARGEYSRAEFGTRRRCCSRSATQHAATPTTMATSPRARVGGSGSARTGPGSTCGTTTSGASACAWRPISSIWTFRTMTFARLRRSPAVRALYISMHPATISGGADGSACPLAS